MSKKKNRKGGADSPQSPGGGGADAGGGADSQSPGGGGGGADSQSPGGGGAGGEAGKGRGTDGSDSQSPEGGGADAGGGADSQSPGGGGAGGGAGKGRGTGCSDSQSPAGAETGRGTGGSDSKSPAGGGAGGKAETGRGTGGSDSKSPAGGGAGGKAGRGRGTGGSDSKSPAGGGAGEKAGRGRGIGGSDSQSPAGGSAGEKAGRGRGTGGSDSKSSAGGGAGGGAGRGRGTGGKDSGSKESNTGGGWFSNKRDPYDPANRDKYLAMSFEEKRAEYACGKKYVTLDDVTPWAQHSFISSMEKRQRTSWSEKVRRECGTPAYFPDLNEKVSLWRGDITSLEVDCIVNAANESLLGGGGVDGAIHRAAGELLRKECETLHGCQVGVAKTTCGYKLPAKYVVHTVGPRGEQPEKLRNAYANSLHEMEKRELKTIAFPCISTGIYGYPNHSAAVVALDTVRKFLESSYGQKVERVIFCLFMNVDVEMYELLTPVFFPKVANFSGTFVDNELVCETARGFHNFRVSATISSSGEVNFSLEQKDVKDGSVVEYAAVGTKVTAAAAAEAMEHSPPAIETGLTPPEKHKKVQNEISDE